MGYRSVIISDPYGGPIPDWFVEKWGSQLNFGDNNGTPIASKFERKYNDGVNEAIFQDLTRVVRDGEDPDFPLDLVLLHDGGAINWVRVTADAVQMAAPDGWTQIETFTAYRDPEFPGYSAPNNGR